MEHRGLLCKLDTVALQLQTQTDVDIFTVHEILNIKAAQTPEYLRRKEHECAIDPIF